MRKGHPLLIYLLKRRSLFIIQIHYFPHFDHFEKRMYALNRLPLGRDKLWTSQLFKYLIFLYRNSRMLAHFIRLLWCSRLRVYYARLICIPVPNDRKGVRIHQYRHSCLVYNKSWDFRTSPTLHPGTWLKFPQDTFLCSVLSRQSIPALALQALPFAWLKNNLPWLSQGYSCA